MLDPLPIIITVAGVFILIKIRAFFIFRPIKTVRLGLCALRGRDAFKSFSLALAGTLGVGNVLGVAVGIIIGGAGSVFWLLLSTVFAAALKYAEVLVSSPYSNTKYGMIAAVKDKLGPIGGVFSKLYALCALMVAFVMGAALQCGTVVECAKVSLNLPDVSVALTLCALIVFAVSGGGELIEKTTSIIIPLTTIVYISLTLGIIIIKFENSKRIISRGYNIIRGILK